jgi:hypothetical protein
LTLAASVAQRRPAPGGPQSAGTTTGPSSQQSAAGGGETAEELKDVIAQTLGKDLQAIKSAGSLVKQKHTDNDDSIKSTGVPAVDALLLNMGFRPA